MDDSDLQTVPLDNTYVETVVHHDREFQRYALDNGVYFAPVDEDEAERLRIIHNVFNRMFEGRLIFPPMPQLRRVLECGFGSASWAIDVAEQYPTCEVIGIDIYPNMAPEIIPPNLNLQVDDLNRPSTFASNHFDLVNSRLMAGGIHSNRWGNYMADILRVLRPGGWCQMVEIYFNAQSDNGTLTDNHALRTWSSRYLQSLQPYKDPRAALQLQNWMTDAGFVEVERRLIILPLSGWSSDPRDHDLGVANRDNVHRLLASLAIYPFTERLGMTPADVQLLVAQARIEADNPAFKAYFPVYVCIGRKPGGSGHSKGSRHHHSHRSGRNGDTRKRART
ncbi:S-adenosyl-L-methionine-dependent methyltransferase [Phialemonium atrogriseum]|uniref:S-adenosyl-L-methionine-dependent methyltransferase n=1 Tax=Phialemonium atrogriseum TaxID=1093897 RepID=A0AAJ0BZK7_9PEZI|nr:S-adenosyl-L-methionine-dependent methyltransferase [Phialemonium atrogriseum]KAK1766742.1 S-adenosyl-L-methionine-dependent methyltransferase [Phialemonium atrogriseum]